MAEPARKIYDDDDSKPVTRPDLEVLEGGGEASEPRKGHLGAVDDKKSAEPKELDNAEKKAGQNSDATGQHDNTVGQGYSPGSPTKSGMRQLLSGRRKKYALAGGAAAALIALFIAAFSFFFLPLKILHIVNNLQSRFYATSENAMERETSRLFANYLRTSLYCKRVPVIDSDTKCSVLRDNNTLVKKLYRGWWEGKIEDRMANNGVRFRYDKSSKEYAINFNNEPGKSIYLGNPELGEKFFDPNNPNALTLDDFIKSNGNFEPATRNQVRQAALAAFKAQSRYDKTMVRIKVGRFLESKYGIRRCIVGCKVKDDFADWKDDKKIAAKMWISERVLQSRNELYTLVMQCIYAPGDICSKERVINAVPSDYSADPGGCQIGCTQQGAPKSESDKEMEAKLIALVASYGSDKDSLRRIFDTFEKNGFVGGLLKSYAGTKVDDFGESNGNSAVRNNADVIAKLGTRAIPIIGWVILGSQVVVFLDEAPEVIAKLQYVTNSTAMTQIFSMYRTHADEIKEGSVDAAIVGSFVDSLGPGDHRANGSVDQQIGGTAGAEGTPLYQTLIGNTQQKTIFGSILSPKVSAAEPYTCHNGQSVPSGKLVCEEENLRQKSWFLSELEKLKAIPGWGLLAGISQDIVGTMNSLISKIFSFISDIPVIGDLLNKLLVAVSDLAGFLADYSGLGDLIKKFSEAVLGINLHMVSANMSGGRTFDMVAAGADVSGNEFAHYGLGGRELSNTEVASILREQEHKKQIEFEQKPFLARLFDKDNSRSLSGQLALAMPSNTNSIGVKQMMSFMAAPLRAIGNTFGSLISPKLGAITTIPTSVADDPFGVIQYGYPTDDPTLKEDPDTFWNTKCVGPNNLTQLYNLYSANNLDESYMPLNNIPNTSSSGNDLSSAIRAQAAEALLAISPQGTNRCALIQAAAGSAGAIFTNDVLTPEELADSPATVPTTTQSTGTNPGTCTAGVGPGC